MSLGTTPYSLKIPVSQRDVYYPLLDDKTWSQEFDRVRLPYERAVLVEGQIGPQLWVQLTSYTVGQGRSGRSVWIELASRRPSPSEIVAGRGLLRAFASNSSERRRLLDQILVHIILLEYTDDAHHPLWQAPSNSPGLSGALVGAETVASPAIWSAIAANLEQNRPSTAIALRDVGGVAGLDEFSGFTTTPVELPAGVRSKILTEMEYRWSRFGTTPRATQGMRWVHQQIGEHPDISRASSMSQLMRSGDLRHNVSQAPAKPHDGGLGLYYPRNRTEVASCAAIALVPVVPGVLWDVTSEHGGDAQTTAGFAHQTQGTASYTAFATSMRAEERADFLLTAASAAIVSSAAAL